MGGLRYPDQLRPRHGSNAWRKTPSVRLSQNLYTLSTIAFLGPLVGYCRAIYMAIHRRSRGAHQRRQDRTPHGAQCKCRRPRCGKIARSHTVHASGRLAFLCVIRRFFELGALELPVPFENFTIGFDEPQGVVDVVVRLRPPQQTFVLEPFDVGKVA